MRIAFVLVLTSLPLLPGAQSASGDATDPVRVGPGVTPPKLQYRVEPEYSPEARNAGVQGTIVFDVVVNAAGRVVNASVINPLGFGLEEMAQAAIEKWRFEPGRKDGKPVSIVAVIEVNFRLQGRYFDSKAEEQRVRFNVALDDLKANDPDRGGKAVKTLEELTKKSYPPAMYVLGKLLETGGPVPRDEPRGALLVGKAADKHHGPAMFDIGLAYFEGKGAPQDTERGLRMMHAAAQLGSYSAQFYLGNYYEQGAGAARDADRARRSFRLCAAAGHADCQVRLAKLLLELTRQPDHDFVQAIAWLKLAAAQGQAGAQDLVDTESSGMTPEQVSAVLKLKAQLAHKR